MKTHTVEGQRMLDRVGGFLRGVGASSVPRTSAGTAAAIRTAWRASDPDVGADLRRL